MTTILSPGLSLGRRAAAAIILLLHGAMTTSHAFASEPPPPAWPQQSQRNAAAVFVSGHSLTDEPMPSYLEAIARSLGGEHTWNRQDMSGSTIQQRSRGASREASDWPGYRQGSGKAGGSIDVVAELRNPTATAGKPYDVLLITEMHALLVSYLWFDTVRLLRHYHDLFISANPEGRTYFYEPWLDISDKNAPARWIAYERAASPMWQCAVNRINLSLQQEGRPDRITPLPAGLALAELIARATEGPGLPGITAATPRETVDRLISDSVHLTPAGMYYVALVSYAAIYRRSPVGAWAPDGIDKQQARTMQEFAWTFVSDFYARTQPSALADCRAQLSRTFNDMFWDYSYDLERAANGWTPPGLYRSAKGWLRKRRNAPLSLKTFTAEDAGNPLYFSPGLDQRYWHPPL